MIKLVRAQTRDGGTVIDFLDDVMHGREDGFKTNHRIAAGRELISHILRDEHVIARTVLEVVADPRVRPLPASQIPSPSTLTPSPSTGEGWGEGDSPARGSRRGGFQTRPPRRGVGTRNSPTVVRADARRNPGNTAVVPAQAGFLRRNRPPPRGAARGAPSPSKSPGSFALKGSCPEGQCSGGSTVPVPGPGANEADLPVVPAQAGTPAKGRARTRTRYGAGSGKSSRLTRHEPDHRTKTPQRRRSPPGTATRQAQLNRSAGRPTPLLWDRQLLPRNVVPSPEGPGVGSPPPSAESAKTSRRRARTGTLRRAHRLHNPL